MDEAPTSTPKKVRRARTRGPYKGVRMRSWGKWVSEIRIPKTKRRIWLGSYDDPETAARAYDAALYCVRGESGKFNFPDDRRPMLPKGAVGFLSKENIQAIAANFALSDASVTSPEPSVSAQVSLPALPDFSVSSEIGSACEVVSGSLTPASVSEAATPSAENLQLDDMLMLDVDWLNDLF